MTSDARQSLRLVRPRATAQGKLPPPAPPSLHETYNRLKANGLPAVLQDYEEQQRDYNRKFASWFAQQQQQGESSGSSTTSQQGPAGPQGPPGPPGPAGSSGLEAIGSGRILGRIKDRTGAVEQLTRDQVAWFLRSYPNALADTDWETLYDVDGDPLYPPNSARDNPPLQIIVFDTVDEMLQYPADKVNEAVTINWEAGDGNMQMWEMIANPEIVPNGNDILASYDGWGVYRSFSCRGKSYEDQFTTRREVGALLGTDRYTHSQGFPLATWSITHGLNRAPNVVVEDVSGQRISVDVVRTGLNTVELRFAFPRSGTAYLS